jgi:hypothetical protein
MRKVKVFILLILGLPVNPEYNNGKWLELYKKKIYSTIRLAKLSIKILQMGFNNSSIFPAFTVNYNGHFSSIDSIRLAMCWLLV